ncbi:hypothetical protein N9D38_05510 [Rubripirellula sp.]|nr:hypothetical protein [Rubripirellula sp.]
MSAVSRQWTDGLQLNAKTAEVLGKFDRRRRFLLVIRGIASSLVILFSLVAVITCIDYIWLIPDPVRWALSVCAYGVSLFVLYSLGIRPMGHHDPEQIARQVEASEVKLKEDLLSAVELANPLHVNGAVSFRNRLQDNVAVRVSSLDVVRLLPVRLISRWLLTAVALLGLFILLSLLPGLQFGRRIARAMIPGAAIQRASMTKILVLQPTPASGFVAEGDAIAIVVEVTGKPADEVRVQWRDEDGLSGDLLMTPRAVNDTESLGGTLAFQNRYAVNLSVGTAPVHYRVLGGDGVTLWETLTPLPRPRVVNFNKSYQFPDYSLLSPRSEDAEHGDLAAVIGTKVNLTVQFDEPVAEPMIHFDDDGGSQELVSKDGSNIEFSVLVTLRTPSTYQIDAVSLKSGLNNPYSPIYSIDPLRDAPPFVRWAEEMDRMMMVSPLDVIPLHGYVTDDLPIDQVVQEFEINGQAASVRAVPMSQADRELDLKWEWDLLHRQSPDVESPKLENGDFIRLRFVAIDRNSQRSESALLEILVADEGFDVNRHQHLDQIAGLVDEIVKWSGSFHELMDPLGSSNPEDLSDRINDRFEKSQVVLVSGENLVKRIETTLGTALSLPEAGAIELSGVALLDLVRQQKRWMDESLELIKESPEVWEDTRLGFVKERIGLAKKYANESLRIQQYSENLFAELVTVAMVADAKALQESLKPMLVPKDESSLPIERFPRYLLVSIGRLTEINDLLKVHGPYMPEDTLRHLEAWENWSDSWATRFESSIQSPPNEDGLRSMVKQFSQELQSQIDGRMIDGRIGGKLQSLLRDLQTQIGPTRDLVNRLEQLGRDAEVNGQRATEQVDSQQATKHRKDQAFSLLSYGFYRDHLLRLLEKREVLHRGRPNVDLSYAADTKLMKRAIENITSGGYAPYEEEPAIEVYQNIGKAYQVIESAHDVRTSLQELTQLLLAERRLEETASNKVSHPTWLERFSTQLELPSRFLREVGIPGELVQRIEENRYNDQYNQARDRILMRRWSGEPMLTGEVPLLAMQVSLESAMNDLELHVTEARQVLQKYVLSLSQQARQAADAAEAAKERTEQREDSQQQTADQLATQQRDVEQATDQTLESLMDLANTSSLTDASERELARDADIASAEIQEAAEKADALMQQATQAETDQERSDLLDQTAEALQDLANSLEQTAEHFELAEQGQDLSESRQQLRQDAQSDLMPDDLDQRYEDAEQLASDAQMSAEQRLQELEQELQQNQPMQQELSDIARRATEAAQRTLEKVAEQERGVMQTLERSDASFQEKKTRAAAELAAITQRAQAVDQSLLNATEQAIGWANTPEARPKLDETRTALREAIEQSQKLGGDQAPLEEMQAAAKAMGEAIGEANQAVNELNQQTNAAQNQNIHQDESSRNRTKSQVERFARDSRTQQLRSAAEQQKQWASAEQQANRRIQDAQRQKRDAENQRNQAQQQLAKNPDAAPQLQPQIDAAQDRVKRAEQAEQAARETKDFASQRAQQTRDRENQIKSQPLDTFEQLNPAAELATDMTQQAAKEFGEIQQSLQQLSQQMNFADQLNAPQQTLDQVANQQGQMGQRIDEAIEQLERAARHEERLGQQEMADQLNQAAESVSQNAANAANQALTSLQQAESQTDLTPNANREVSEAAQAVGNAADSLSEMLQEMMMQSAEDSAGQSVAQQASQPSSPTDADPSNESASGQLSQDQQLAQTLDELDRQLASQANAQSSQPSGEPSDAQSSSQQTVSNEADSQGQDSQGQQDGQDGQGSPTAAQASPTVANNLNSQAQQAARQRQQQLDPSQNQSGQPGEPNQQKGNSSTASDQSGNGQMPNGGRLDPSEIDRLGADWGSLRERKTDEVNEGRSATVSPFYRQQVEAYFRAIARQAAEKKASGK